MAKILIFIGAHLCTAPRPQKEAATFAAAGHDVMVCGVWFDSELAARDQALIREQSYRFHPLVDFRPGHSSHWQRGTIRAQAKIAREIFRRGRIFSPALLGYGAKAMVHFAKAQNADLNIFHSEAGLWAGAELLNRNYPVGVDFEDWFSEDLLPSARETRPVQKIQELERSLCQRCTYKLTTSHEMAKAMAEAFDTASPTVIYNSFSKKEGVWNKRDSSQPLKLH